MARDRVHDWVLMTWWSCPAADDVWCFPGCTRVPIDFRSWVLQSGYLCSVPGIAQPWHVDQRLAAGPFLLPLPSLAGEVVAAFLAVMRLRIASSPSERSERGGWKSSNGTEATAVTHAGQRP